MSQLLCTSRGPVPNVLTPIPLGDHGALIIRAGDRYFVWSKNEFVPAEGMTKQEWLKRFHHTVPSNLSDGWWGITSLGAEYDVNWSRASIQACNDMFVAAQGQNYQKPDGTCFDPYKKGRMLARITKEKLRIVKQPAPQPRN